MPVYQSRYIFKAFFFFTSLFLNSWQNHTELKQCCCSLLLVQEQNKNVQRLDVSLNKYFATVVIVCFVRANMLQ